MDEASASRLQYAVKELLLAAQAAVPPSTPVLVRRVSVDATGVTPTVSIAVAQPASTVELTLVSTTAEGNNANSEAR